MRLLAVGVLALALSVGTAAAAPPSAGILVPGTSLGGLGLGATKAKVERAWGRAYGICTGCPSETWYFNFLAFQPQGVGVEFGRGRVQALFTLHSPTGWHTRKGLALGDASERVTGIYGPLTRIECDGYHALVLRHSGARTAFYVLRGRLWAFGLARAGVAICR